MILKFNIINRYIIRVIIPNFLLGLAIFCIINLIQYLFELIPLFVEKDVPFGTVMKLLLYIIPFIMTFTVPAAVLMGIILAVGELSSNSEVIAMRTNGISMPNIFKPAIFFGLMVALLHILFFQFVLPWGNKNFILTKHKIIQKNPTVEISNKKKLTEGNYEIRVERSDTKTKTFYNIKIVNFKENLIFISDKGQLMDKDETNNVFPLVLRNVIGLPYVFSKTEKNMNLLFYEEMRLFIKDIDIKKVIPKGAQLEGITELIDTIREKKLIGTVSEIKAFHNLARKERELLDADLALAAMSEPEEKQKQLNLKKMLAASVNSLKNSVKNLRSRIKPESEVYFLHRKFSYAISALLMAFLAAPLGLIKRRKGKEIAFGLGFIVFFLYNGILIAGNVGFERKFVSPEFAAWFPNVAILLIIGVVGYLKIRKS